MSKKKSLRSKAFTLIELLVVIAIIALLLSILMPGLKKAQYFARRVVCTSNVHQQLIAQLTYATEWDGKFPEHLSSTANYVSNGTEATATTRWKYAMKDTYITDSEVLLCPILKKNKDWWPFYYDNDDLNYGWDTDNLGCQISYNWYANFAPMDGSGNPSPITFLSGESPWPKNSTECNSTRAMITHDVEEYIWGLGGTPTFYDASHGSRLYAPIFDDLESTDNPVGRADGHVDIVKKSHTLPRAEFTYSGSVYVKYYY